MSRRSSRALAALVLGLAAARLPAAGPVPNGPTFKIATCSGCILDDPGVAGSSGGKFLAVYDAKSALLPSAVKSRAFRPAATPFGPGVNVPSATGLPQYDAAIAGLPSGAAVVAWSEINAAARNSDVWAQRFDAAGKPAGSPIAVNVDPGYVALDTLPAVAMAADGGFVVAWLRSVPPGQPAPIVGLEVWGRRFGASGTALGPPKRISNGLVEGARPSVCVDTQKRTVVVWATDDAIRPFEPSLVGVSLRRLSAAGIPIGAQVVVAPAKAQRSHPVVSCGASAAFVVAWESDQLPARAEDDIVARRYGADGKPLGAAFLVNTSTAGSQRLPHLGHDAAGNFVVVWKDLETAGGAVAGRRYAATGTAQGGEFKVAPLAHSHSLKTPPRIAMAGPAGAFVVAWDDDDAGLLGRRFKIAP